MTICKFKNILLSPARTNRFWLLPMVCVLRRNPRSNIWSAWEDQNCSFGLAFHRCATANLDSEFQNPIPFLIVATSSSSLSVFMGSDLQSHTHTTKSLSSKESIYDCEWKKKENLPAWIMNYLFTHFSHQLFICSLEWWRCQMKCGLSKCELVMILSIRIKRRKSHTCSSKKEKEKWGDLS